MRKTLLIMRAEISATLRRKTFLFFAFILPLLLGLIAGVVMFVNRDKVPTELPSAADLAAISAQKSGVIGYVDASGLIAALPADVSADELQRYPDEAAADAALASGAISGYFILPADYLRSGELTFVTPSYNPLSDDIGARRLEWALMYNLLGENAELAARIRQPLQVEATSLAPPVEKASEESWITEMFPTLMVLILYMVILIPAGVLVNSVTDEKKNRVLEVLMASVSPRQLLSGKIMALGLLGLLEAVAWLGIMWFVVRFGGAALAIPEGFTIPISLIVWSFVFFMLGYAIYGSQLAAVGALANDVKETRAANFLVMAPIILAYVFMIFIFESPNSPVAIALSLFPLTSPIAMIARLVTTDVPVWQPVLAALILVVSVIFTVRLTARMFRAQVLLSGQPFSARGYYKTLLGRTS